MDMGITGSFAATTGVKQAQVQSQVQMCTLKQCLDAQKQSAKSLMQAMPAKNMNPSHLGKNIDMKA